MDRITRPTSRVVYMETTEVHAVNGVQRFLLRAPRHGATASGNEMVELPKVLYDAMLAVAQAASDHTSTYLGETRSPGQWELEVHRTRLAMFESIRILGEVNG